MNKIWSCTISQKKKNGVKVVIILKAMAALNLSTKNSNRGRKIYLAIIRSRSVNIFLFSVSYETDSKSNMIKYYSFLSFPDKTASADFNSVQIYSVV